MTDPIIGQCRFTDGSVRDVYRASDGDQYVLDDFGIPVKGLWVLIVHADADVSVNVRRIFR